MQDLLTPSAGWAALATIVTVLVTFKLSVVCVLDAFSNGMTTQQRLYAFVFTRTALRTLLRQADMLREGQAIVDRFDCQRRRLLHKLDIISKRSVHMQHAFELLYGYVLARQPDTLTTHAKFLADLYEISVEEPGLRAPDDLDDIRATAQEIRSWVSSTTEERKTTE